MAGTISFSGLSTSGIDSSAWVDALVSVKQQTITTLQEEKEAQENLLSIVNDIKSYFTSFQSCLAKLTDSQYGIPTMDLFMQNLAVSSNTNIATATATVEASRQSYDVLVDQLATATKANSGYVQYEVKRATLDTQLGVLGVTNGTVTVNSQSFSVTTEDTIKDLINKFDSVGVSANFDEEKGVFTVGVGIDEIDEGATNLKSALKLSDNNIDGAVSGSLVYVTRDTEFSKLGLTGGRIVIEDKNYLIVKNGDEYTISDDTGVEHQMNTVGDFFDYLMSSAVNAEEATVDDKGNIVIKGAKIDSVEFGSNLLEVLNLTETNDRTVMESQELSYNKDHVADLTTQLSSLGINDTKTLVVGGTTHNITSDKTLGDIKELLNANGVEFNIDEKGVITVDTKGNEISGTLLDALGLDPTKAGSTITSTPHLAKLQATGDTLLSELGVDDSMSYVAYKSDGTALTTTISGLSNKTVDELIADLKAQGVNASFDSVNHQILIDDGYIEGTLADQLGMSKSTTTYTESATLSTTLEKLGSTGNETLTIDGGAATTYGKDTTLQTILDDITAAGGNVTFKDGNVTISGVTLGGSIPGLLGLDATTQGSTVTSGELTIVTGSSSSGGDLDETVEYDITLSSKIGDILGTTNDYTLTVEDGAQVTYTKDTTLQALKDQIEAEGGIFRINEDNTITIDGVTMSGTLVGALGFESVENGTRFSTVNPVMVQGSSNIATGGTSLGQLGLGGVTTFDVAPMATPTSMTLSIDGGAEITYDSTTTLDDIFADIQAAGGKAYIDSEGYIIIEDVNLSGTLVDALGLQVTSYGSTITSGNIQVATSTTSTSSSELVAEGKGDITWDSTIGSITDETISYDLSINGNSVAYGADTKLSEIKAAIENAGGTMTINSDNTITINGVSASGSLMDALGFDITDYKTTISSNMPIYAIGEDKIADESTSFDALGIDSNLRDYAVYMPDGTVVKASSTDGSSGTKTIGDWLDKVNSALNTANGTSGVDYAQINNGVITITGGYVDGSLATALGIGKETVVADVTLTGKEIQYVEYKPLEYISSVRVQDGESAKDVTHNGSIGVNATESGTASSDINSSGFVTSNDTFEDLFGNIDEATLNTTLAELLNPDVNDPLNNDATLQESTYTLKIGTYAEQTFDASTTTLGDLINYIENLKTYDPTYDRAFDASYVDGTFTIKSDMAMSGTLLDALGFNKVGSEIGYYTYTTNKSTFTDLIEGASNGYNFSIVGGKVQYQKTETIAGGGYEYTGEKITYSKTETVNSGYDYSAKLVDLLGSSVIGKTVSMSSYDGSAPDILPTVPGTGRPGSTVNQRPSHMHPNTSYKFYTIDANTTVGDLLSWSRDFTELEYSNGKLILKETSWSDGCSSEMGGTFFDYLTLESQDYDSNQVINTNDTYSEHTYTYTFAELPTVYEDKTTTKTLSKDTTVSDLCPGSISPNPTRSTKLKDLGVNGTYTAFNLTVTGDTTIQELVEYFNGINTSSNPSYVHDFVYNDNGILEFSIDDGHSLEGTLWAQLKLNHYYDSSYMVEYGFNLSANYTPTTSPSSQTLNISVGGAASTPLTFSSTASVQDIIDKLAEYDINATVTSDGRFKVTSDERWTLSGALASKLFGGSGNEVYEYTGSKVTYTVTTTAPGTVDSNGFINTPSIQGGGASGDGSIIVDSNGFITTPGSHSGGSSSGGSITVDSDGFINTPSIQGGSSGTGSTTIDANGFIQTPNEHSNGAITTKTYVGSQLIYNKPISFNDYPNRTMGEVGLGDFYVAYTNSQNQSYIHSATDSQTIGDFMNVEGYGYDFVLREANGNTYLVVQHETNYKNLTITGATKDSTLSNPGEDWFKLNTITNTMVADGDAQAKDIFGTLNPESFDVTINGSTHKMSFYQTMPISYLVYELNNIGCDASFENGVLIVSSSDPNFTIESNSTTKVLFGGTVPTPTVGESSSTSGPSKYVGTTVKEKLTQLDIPEDIYISDLNPDAVGEYLYISSRSSSAPYHSFRIQADTTVGDLINYFESCTDAVSSVEFNDATLKVELKNSSIVTQSGSAFLIGDFGDSMNISLQGLIYVFPKTATESTTLQKISGVYDGSISRVFHTISITNNGKNSELSFIGSNTIQDVLDKLNSVDGVTASFTNGILSVESIYSDLAFNTPSMGVDLASVLFGGSVPIIPPSESSKVYVSSLSDFVSGETYYLKDAADLNKLAELVNAGKSTIGVTFILDNDIDMSSVANFAGIGSSSSNSYFGGTFYGNGHVIKNLKMSSTDESSVGLFGQASGATIEDLGLENVNITGNGNVGALIGSDTGPISDRVIVKNVYVKGGTVQSTSSDVSCSTGGLIGKVTTGMDISYAYADVDVISETTTGGLLGLSGSSGSTIDHSFALGNVTSTGSSGVAGGLVGTMGPNNKITNSFATGDVKGVLSAGGFAGSLTNATIETSYSTGKVSGALYNGGFVGSHSGSTFSGAVYNSDNGLSGCSDSGCNGLSGMSLSEMQKESLMGSYGFTAENGWVYTTGSTPNFGNITITTTSGESVVYVSSLSDFVSGETYYIKSAADLNKLAELVNSGKDTTNVTFILENDIDMSGVANFTPIGNDSNSFEGSFYGNGHVIKNLTIDSSNSYVGLFGYVKNATIEDVGLVDVNITNNASPHSASIGSLVGVLGENSTVKNVYATGNITDNNIAYMLGGLAGEVVDNATIIDSYSSVNIVSNGEYVGGLVGFVNGTIEHSYSTGDVTGGDNVGGIAGGSSGDISRVYATGNIKNTNSNYGAGGLVGLFTGGSLIQSYFSGEISGAGKIGGAIGVLSNSNSANITNVRYNKDNILVGIGSGSNSGVVGLSSSDMQNQSVMENNGFTTANGWQYTSGSTPHFGNMSMTITPGESVVYVSSLSDFVSGDTYYIKDAADLNKLAELVNSGKSTAGVTFILENDIDMSGVANFTPIGNDSNSFEGSFYGNGHVIKNLTINLPDQDYVGLFGSLSNGTIEDLGLENIDIEGNLYVGGLVGDNRGGNIKNSYVTGSIVAKDYVGGLVGSSYDGNINNSYSNVELTANCYVGGLIGSNNSNVTNSYAIGDVNAKVEVGGLIGANNSGTITNVFSTGNVSGNDVVGALVGSNSNANVTNAYAIGNVSSTGSTVGAIVGALVNGTYTNVVYNTSVGLTAVGDGSSTGIIGKTLSDMTNQSIMEGLGFNSANGWQYTSGSTPHFGNMSMTITPGESVVYVSSLSDFVSGDTYYIKDAADLNKLAELVNSGKSTAGVTFILENDIDMSGVANFTPISNFEGSFYGNGHIIENLTINSNGGPVGLFAEISGALIQDLGLKNVDIGDDNATAGALVGQANNSTIFNTYVDGGSVTGATAGGLVGYNSSSNIVSSYATVDVHGDTQVGGLVGFNEGVIRNSYATGNVDGRIRVGGLAGVIGYGSIYSSYSTGNVTGDSDVGGLVGYVDGATDINITNSYSTGNVTGNSNVGGFAGFVELYSYTNTFSGNIYNSSSNSKAFGKITYNNSTVDIEPTGLTLEDMQNQSIMEGLGFTSANGWHYTAGSTPHFGNMTGSAGSTTTTTYDASLSTTVGQLFGDSSSHTLTVDGSNITFSSTDTISDIFDKLWNDNKIHASMENGIISLDSNNDHVLTGDLAQKLFGSSNVDLVGSNGGASDKYTMERSEDGSGTTTTTTTETMTENSTIGDLFGDSNNHTFTINGEDITLGSDDTIQDLIDNLKAKGYEVSLTDGKLTIGSNGYEEFTVSGDLAEKVLATTGTITSDYKTQTVTLSTSSRMEDIFWDANNHNFVINKADGGSVTITLGKNDTIQTLFDKLKQNGIVATINDGEMTFKSNYKWSASGDIADKIINAFNENITYFDIYDSHELNEYTGHQTVSQMLNAGESLVNGFRYHISSAEDLKALATFVNEKGQDTTNIDFVLDGNITLDSSFASIGTSSNAFKGNFHGNGYTISGAQKTIFANTSSAEIRDVGVVNANVSGADNTGILIGSGSNTEIANVYVTGSVSGGSNTGALAGSLTGSTVTDSYSNATVFGSSNVGGFVGSTTSTNITRAYSTGDVTASGSKVGGFVGNHASGTITSAYATGNVKGNSTVGGFVGANSGTISNAYSTSRVYGSTNGAFAGSNSGTFTGNVYNSNLEIAGVGSGSSSGLTAKTFVEMQNQSIMQGLGFTADKGWKYTSYNTPYIGTITTDVAGGTRRVSQVSELRAGDTYYINDKNDLTALSNFVKNGADTTGVTFILNNDVDMSGVNFAPIGSYNNTFRGDFYGNGHEISNLQVSVNGSYAGLFGYAEGALIQDVAIVDASIEASDDYSGALVGYADSGTIIKNSYSSGQVIGTTYVGGLVGYNAGSIDSSYSTAEVSTSDNGGGLAGVNTGNIRNSYSTGNVSGWSVIGGFVGTNSGTIETAYSTGRVVSQNSIAGGFVGDAQSGSSISNSYSTGYVEGSSSVGGFIGNVVAGVSISGNVFNSSTTLNAVGSGASDGITGLVYEEMWNKEKMESLGFTADKGWLYTDNSTPYLNSNVSFTNGGKVYVSQVDSFVSGEVFYISTKEDLNKLAQLVNNGALTVGVTFVLENDIDASGIDVIANTQDNAFQGLFSGNGNTISGLTHSLFGYTENATIRDVGVNVNINSSSSSIVGALISDDLGNTKIENTYSKGSINAGSNVGGLVGRLGDGSTLQASYSEVVVTGSNNVGGLVGVVNGANIINSFASGNVTATSSYGGGLVGSLNDGASISSSYATGNVSGGSSLGGFVGITSNSTITGSYSAGLVSGTSAKGFIGTVSGSNTISGNIYNNATADNVAGAQGLSLDNIKDQSIMESYGFTSDKGWQYYEGKTPMLQGRDKSLGNSYSVDVSLDSALWMLGDSSISKNMSVVVNGNTYEKYFNENDTVEDVMNWLNGISDINVSFDESNSTFTVTSDYEDLALAGGLANILFGGYANREENTIVQNTESQDLMKPGEYEKITEDTTIKSLLNSNNSSVIGYIDDSGNYVTETFEADQTVGDVIDYLESQGFEVSLVDGVFTAVKQDGSKTDLLGAIGSALKGSDGTVVSEGSGFVSDILSSTVGVTADGSTKLSALGVDSGKIQVKSGSGAIVQTLEIDNNMTINDLASMLSNYGFNLSINNGKVTVTAEGDNTLVNGTSNLVSKLKLDTWNKDNEKLEGSSTLSEMGFSQGASLGVIVDGKSLPNLTFMANDTLDTIISRLQAYGIEASVDENGKFTAKSDSSFVLTGELGSYLTQNSANGYEEFANGYKSENPVEIAGTISKLTEDTLIGDLLGTGEGGILRLTLDEDRVIDLAYNANDTVKDIMVDLAGYGINAEINDGVLTAISQDRTYRFSGEIGEALSGNTPMYDDISTGYVSKDLGYEIVGTATLDSTLKELGISAGQIHVMDSNNNIVTTLDVDDSFTVSQVKAMLMPYGIDLSMDSNGSVTVTTNNGYKITDGTSNMVSKMGLTNWNMPTEKLNLNTTIAQMGFANGADLNLFLDGAVQNILSFDSNQTLQDVIFALSAYGIDASVDANGKFTATSDAHTFVMSNSLGSFLTKGTSGYVTFDSAYKTDETLTEDFDYVNSTSSKLEYQENMTLDSTLESLGFANGGNVIVSLDGQTHYTLSFLASDTVQDVVYALSAYGIDATVDNNGQFSAESVDNEFVLTGNLGSYLVSGGIYQNEDTGYQSGELGYETIEKVTNDTKLSELGVMHGDINIIKDGKLSGSTINITDDTTVGQLFNAIKVHGMTGSIKTNDAGETYIEVAADSNTYLADGTSNIVSGLGLVSVRQGDYKGDVIYWEDETDSGLITEDMLLSDLDRNGYIAQGSLIFETGTGDEAEEHIINIASDETVGSLLKKLNNTGVTAVLDNGVIKINAGTDGITFKGGTSGLVNTIGLDIEDVDVYASSSSALTYEGEVAYSAANYANGNTKLSVVNVTNGEMNLFVDGIKCTIQVNSEDSFADFFTKVSAEVANKTGLTIKAGFLNKSGEIVVNPTDAENTGVIAFEVEGEHELVIGSTIDTTNFATIANLNKAGYNEVVGSRSLYRVNVNSKITESGLFRDGDITEGTFKIGDAEFTIDSNTTLSSLIDQINKSQTAYATAYWDTLSGTMVIQSTLTGASLINIEAGSSNFTDILGFTTEKNGVSALVTDNQTLGKNAVISINGTKVTASSNVITSEVSKIKGLTINLKNVSEGETVTISVERDDEAIYNAVSETIDAYNAMMEALNKELSNKETLGNQSLLKLMRNNLKRLMTSSLVGDYYYKNLAAIGITTGAAQDSITLDVTSLMIDKDQFLEALDTDDDAVKKLLVGTQANPGIFLQANNIVENSIKSTGYFSSMAESLTRSINNIEKKISNANQDIENYRAKLERNFQNMESAISSMQNSYSAFLNKIMS